MASGEGELVADGSDRGSRWIEMRPQQWSLGKEWQAVPLPGRPPATEAPQPPVPKFGGPLVRIRALRSEASATWHVNAGEVLAVPGELAAALIRKGTARLATPQEMPRSE